MKNISLFLLGILLFSCSTKKIEKKNMVSIPQEKLNTVLDILSEEEGNIVNDFLQVELASDSYKSYKNLEMVLLEEAKNRIWTLDAYELAYKEWHRYNIATQDDNERLGWILDSIQIKEFKEKYKYEKEYHWKNTDVKNYNVTIMKNEALRNNTRTGTNIDMPEKLILFITRPIIIDKNNAFISFNSSSGRFGNTINRLTVLMKKTNEKWKMGPGYWDGMID
ncbi:hypothetical protein ACM55F_06405 [Flavobacterium sp. XS2P12]|uniref:hypothetical protein n=1 Tax=Flavobacterium melibiosi TaxID=3398734 RepID=UPI003A88B69D